MPAVFRENGHWDHYLNNCPVCEEFTPDFILSYDDFRKDVNWILQLLYNIKSPNHLQKHKNQHKVNSVYLYKKMINDLPQKLHERLLDWYKYDMMAFGYDDI